MEPFSIQTPVARQAAAAEYWLELTGKRDELANEVKTASVKEAFLKEALSTEAKRRLLGAALGAGTVGAISAARGYRASRPDETGTSSGEREAVRGRDALERELSEEGGGSRVQQMRLAYRKLLAEGETESRKRPLHAALVRGLVGAGTGGAAGALLSGGVGKAVDLAREHGGRGLLSALKR
jgi:hypothetical protein